MFRHSQIKASDRESAETVEFMRITPAQVEEEQVTNLSHCDGLLRMERAFSFSPRFSRVDHKRAEDQGIHP